MSATRQVVPARVRQAQKLRDRGLGYDEIASRLGVPRTRVYRWRVWADAHGGIPPTCMDWRRADVDHPSNSAVVNRLGWDRAIRAAGYLPRLDRRPETTARIVEEIASGLTTVQVADLHGVSESAISQRVRRRGLTVEAIRAGARLS